jgi:hypothetical protein
VPEHDVGCNAGTESTIPLVRDSLPAPARPR